MVNMFINEVPQLFLCHSAEKPIYQIGAKMSSHVKIPTPKAPFFITVSLECNMPSFAGVKAMLFLHNYFGNRCTCLQSFHRPFNPHEN